MRDDFGMPRATQFLQFTLQSGRILPAKATVTPITSRKPTAGFGGFPVQGVIKGVVTR